MTEWQGGLLLSRLDRLEAEVNLRNTNMRLLDQGFAEIPGIKVIPLDPRATRGGCHGYKAIFDADEFEGISREDFLSAMRAEGIPMGHWYTTLMYRESFMQSDLLSTRLDYSNVSCSEAEKLCETGLALGQSVLMGTQEDMDDIITATTKVRRYARELKN
jgi:dTDP-4-amino-4,6-dideoxygalactose transaminase